jgi:hypothetical protein
MPILSEGNVPIVTSLVFGVVALWGPQVQAVPMPAEQVQSPNSAAGSANEEDAEHSNGDAGMSHRQDLGSQNLETPSESCLASTICEVKERVRWRTPAWKPNFCRAVAHAVLKAAEQYRLPPALILAVMINESDLNENAVETTYKNGRIYAKDGGLMGIHCVLDQKGRCLNPNPHGLPWQHVMSPVSNIDLGARELAYWRDVGGVEKSYHVWRDRHGMLHTEERLIRCRHKDHAFWAHYNHGERYLDHGRARHYPHRVAVLYYALLQAMSLDSKPLTSIVLTVKDHGQRARTADRPVELRYRKLCQSIRQAGPHCGTIAAAHLSGAQ